MAENGFSHYIRVWKNTDGQVLVEYALLLALIALGAVAGQRMLACQVSCAFENVGFEFERLISGKNIPPGQLKKCSKSCT